MRWDDHGAAWQARSRQAYDHAQSLGNDEAWAPVTATWPATYQQVFQQLHGAGVDGQQAHEDVTAGAASRRSLHSQRRHAVGTNPASWSDLPRAKIRRCAFP